MKLVVTDRLSGGVDVVRETSRLTVALSHCEDPFLGCTMYFLSVNVNFVVKLSVHNIGKMFWQVDNNFLGQKNVRLKKCLQFFNGFAASRQLLKKADYFKYHCHFSEGHCPSLLMKC